MRRLDILGHVGRAGIVFLAIALAACATSSPRPPSTGARFNPSGPDADDFGAREGYPLGDRASFFRVPFLVGSQSHRDRHRVIMTTAVRKLPVDHGVAENGALWRAVTRDLAR